MKRLLLLFVISSLTMFILSCEKKAGQAPERQYNLKRIFEQDLENFSGEYKYSPSSLEKQSPPQPVGTLKISSYGPVGPTKRKTQIHIRFAEPLIPLTTLEDTLRNKILSHFRLEPEVPGRFRFSDTYTVVFQPDSLLPPATEFKVTITAGLKDVRGNILEKDFYFTFSTPLPHIALFPENNATHVDIYPPLRIVSNIPLNVDELRKKVQLLEMPKRIQKSVRIRAYPDNPVRSYFRSGYFYLVEPISPLKRNTTYQLTLLPGRFTLEGNQIFPYTLTSIFRTFEPFRFIESGFCDYCGDKLTTIPYLLFNNNPDFKDLDKYITIEPKPEKVLFSRYSCEEYSIRIVDITLEPFTTYTVTLSPELKDEFGQKLENPQKITFTTGKLVPSLYGPDGLQILSPHMESRIPLKVTSFPYLLYHLRAIRPNDLFVRNELDYSYYIKRFLQLFSPDEHKLELKSDKFGRADTVLNVSRFLKHGRYGVVGYMIATPKPGSCFSDSLKLQGLMVRTDLGIFTQFFPTEGIIMLNRISDGTPVAGATIRIYRREDFPTIEKLRKQHRHPSQNKFKPCLVKKTDAQGMVVLTLEDIRRCASRKPLRHKPADNDLLFYRQHLGWRSPPKLLIVAETDSDWTFLQTSSGGNPSIWTLGVLHGWESYKPIPRAVMFTDQNLYRPGDTVRVKGVVRYLQFGQLRTASGQTFSISLLDDMGKRKYLGKVTTNEYGTFSLEIPLREGQPLGYYQIYAVNKRIPLNISAHFRVGEFRLPEFRVKFQSNPHIVAVNQPLTLSWAAKYYFGAPMRNAKATLHIVRQEFSYQPAEWEQYDFGVPVYLRPEKATLAGVYLTESSRLDEQGKGEKSLRFRESDAPFPMIYRCDLEVEDVSHQTVSARTSVVVLPDTHLVGVRVKDWIVGKEEPIRAEVVVVSPGGRTLPGVPLRVRLLKREYHSIEVKRPDGELSVENHLVLTPVDSLEITSGKEPAAVQLKAPKAGSYVLWVSPRSEKRAGLATAVALWVAGEDYVPWKEEGSDRLKIVLDREEYQIGDTAVAFIQSPFPRAKLFVTIAREKIFQRDLRTIRGGAYTYRFVVTREMIPNAYFTAALIRQGKPLVEVQEDMTAHLERIGAMPFKVSTAPQRLQVAIESPQDTLSPGDSLFLRLRVHRADGTPSRSELTVMIVDEKALALTGYSLPDLVNQIFRTRRLSTRFNDNRPFVVTEQTLLQKGSGYGGGFEMGFGSLRIRKKFLKLAYFNPSLPTNQQGEAQVRCKLPDNLTTWRVMVVAVEKGNYFGNGDHKLVVTQPFLVRPILPRFVRQGDRFLAGVAATNLTGKPGKAVIQMASLRNGIQLHDKKTSVQQIDLKPGETRPVLFSLEAQREGEVPLQFLAELQGSFRGKPFRKKDALKVPLNVEHLQTTEAVVVTGSTENEFIQPLKITPDIFPEAGGLDLFLSPTALTDIAEGARYLVEYPYGCLEQTVSRLLVLMELKYLSEKYGFRIPTEKPLPELIRKNLKKVYRLQNWDGGFKYWDSDRNSAPYLASYVARLFRRSRELGYQMPGEVLQPFIKYLEKVYREPPRFLEDWKSRAEFRLGILQGLQDLQISYESYYEEYFNRRAELSSKARLQLAKLLSSTPGWQEEASLLFREIRNRVVYSARTAHLESGSSVPPLWAFLDSPVVFTARAIPLYLKLAPKSADLPAFVQYLLKARKKGRWRNTYENARVIDALTEYSLTREGEAANFVAQVLVDGKQLLKENFPNYRTPPVEKHIPLSQFQPGENRIVLKKEGKGELHFVLSYRYRPRGLLPGQREGFTIRREVALADGNKLLGEFDEKTTPNLRVTVGQVLRITLVIQSDQSGYHVVVDDPLPAGLEAIDRTLKTTTRRYEADEERSSLLANHAEIHDDRVALFTDYLPAGVYRYTYLVRATTEGDFLWPGATVSLMYEPEQFGRCAEGRITVEKR